MCSEFRTVGGKNNESNVENVRKIFTCFLEGLVGTLWLSLITALFATLFGMIIALAKRSGNPIVRRVTDGYMSVIRGTPILLQLYFFWLLLPKVLPFNLSDTACIVIALIINTSAYVGEVIRAGIQSVDQGQIEAAQSLGMRKQNVFTRIIMPQATKNILPALGNQYISIVKQTSLASVFFIAELTTAYKTVQAATFSPLTPLIISGIIYYLVISCLSKGVTVMERKLMRSESKAAPVKRVVFNRSTFNPSPYTSKESI
ncbi:MAG: amino acid ABC transporter permease [Clostridiales bacterium]|nr:amino acid ABC transporter permease [Clostridiales bacterium]